ncbi:M48 family metalloprotease [Plantactinospora sp. WMMB334]|uniref:M48 family metalloprotease n=1 Tax=Plantactinospora sp. WMMB334 TaxID=3404119 RepID=UPI003B92483D
MPESCPECGGNLLAVEDTTPWCGRCEWNLDTFPPVNGIWARRLVVGLDRRAGFRAGRALAALGEHEISRRATVGFVALVVVSALLTIGLLATAGVGVWLVVTGGLLPPILLGLALIGLAATLRPRLGSRKRAVANGWIVPADSAVSALVGRVADATDAPRPHVIVADLDWNAAVAVVGLRRTRVLRLGVPLLLALDEQQQVAVIGHELGHLKHDDSLRALATMPALTVFGRLARLTTLPPGDAADRGLAGVLALIFSVLQLVMGALSWLFWTLHLGLHLIGAAERRRTETHADLISARAAGHRAALESLDVLALLETRMKGLLHPNVADGRAAAEWRDLLTHARARAAGDVEALRQLTIRDAASMLASHPAPGRRHQWLRARPHLDPLVTVTPLEAETLRAELAPYAEPLLRRIREAHGL